MRKLLTVILWLKVFELLELVSVTFNTVDLSSLAMLVIPSFEIILSSSDSYDNTVAEVLMDNVMY